MSASIINSPESVQTLFSPIGITTDQQAALWNDPDFGLKNPNNYIRWDVLVYGRDPSTYWQLANELKWNFGLTQE